MISRYAAIADRPLATWDRSNQMASWWSSKLLDESLPFQIDSWVEVDPRVPCEALWDDFTEFIGGRPPEWGDLFNMHFGRTFAKIALGPFKMNKCKVSGYYFPGTEHYTRMGDGRLKCYVLPRHQVCYQVFFNETILRFPNFNAFDADDDGKLPLSMMDLI